MRIDKVIASIILCGLLLAGCLEKKAVYHAYQHVGEQWNTNDTLFLQVAIPDSAAISDASLLIRYMDTYPYQNLILNIVDNVKDSLVWRNQTINIDLAQKDDMQLSTWIGLRETLLPLNEIAVISPCTIMFKVTHRMGGDFLSGVNDIGILMEGTLLEPAVASGIDAEEDEQQDRESPQ